MTDKNLRCWLVVDKEGDVVAATKGNNNVDTWLMRDDDRLVEMAPLAELERVRKQRDKLADRIYEMEFKSHPDASFAHAHEYASRALAFAELRVVDGNIEEVGG